MEKSENRHPEKSKNTLNEYHCDALFRQKVYTIHSKLSTRTKRRMRIGSNRHLKMVNRIIRLGALLRSPMGGGHKNRTADNANIVRQRKTLSPSTSNHLHTSTMYAADTEPEKDLHPPEENKSCSGDPLHKYTGNTRAAGTETDKDLRPPDTKNSCSREIILRKNDNSCGKELPYDNRK